MFVLGKKLQFKTELLNLSIFYKKIMCKVYLHLWNSSLPIGAVTPVEPTDEAAEEVTIGAVVVASEEETTGTGTGAGADLEEGKSSSTFFAGAGAGAGAEV
jgi:hypothetical protein